MQKFAVPPPPPEYELRASDERNNSPLFSLPLWLSRRIPANNLLLLTAVRDYSIYTLEL